MKKLLLLLAIVFAATTASAEKYIGEVNSIWYVFDSDLMQAGVTQHYHRGYEEKLIGDGGKGYKGNLVIPSTVNGFEVIGILPHAFDRATEELLSVTIPNTVRYIGEYAFQSCKFESFTIPASIDSLANYALWCIKVKKLTFEDSDDEIFVGKCQINMFSGSEEVEELYLGRNVRSLGGMFANNAVKRVTIGNRVTKISQSCFNNCQSLQTLTLGKGITSIEQDAFRNCTALKSVTLPQSLTYIGWSAFDGCSGLTSIIFPSNLKTIDGWAFSRTNLTELTVPPSVETIGEYAFSLTSLKKVTLKDGPRPLTVGRNASGGSIFSGSIQSIEEAYIGRKLVADEKCSSAFFNNNQTLKKVTFGPYITEVGDYYFQRCEQLQDIKLHANISLIGKYAFTNCNALSQISFPASLKKIDNYAFYNSKGLESLTFNMSLEEIGEGGFYGCNELKTVVLPPYLKTIGNNGFYGDSKITAIYSKAPTPPTCGNSTVFNYLNTKECKLYVPEQSVEAYKAADVWKNFYILGSNSIPTGIRTIGDNTEAAEQRYTIDGQQLGSAKKGLNIVRRPDGTTIKVIVR